MTTVNEYFEQIDGNCKECELSEYCSYYNSTGANTIPNPLCSRIPDEYLNIPIEDLIDKFAGEYIKHLDRLEKKQKEEEAKLAKKAETQRKRKETLWKNRDKNKQRAIQRKMERLAKEREAALKRAEEMAEIMRDVGRMFN